MDPERWQKIERLCQMALALDPSKREAYLSETCQGDESLQKDVEALLANLTEAEGFMKDPAMEEAARALAKEQQDALARDLIGRAVSHYRIMEKIGQGGMGEVYKAHDERLGRDVAIKVLREEYAANPDRLRRFEQEASSASALNHPNIITIHDVGKHEATHYIAMEFVEGKTLRNMLSEGPLPTKKLLQLATQIAEGLAKAHSAGIVHRDLKPENLMVTSDGYVKILDFGLAKLLPQAVDYGSEDSTLTKELTRAGVILGTVGYMSPEQASGRSVDHRSDQFSLGSILYEMATGKVAFKRDTAAEILAAVIEGEPEPVEKVNPNVPAPLRAIVERCLEKNPEERYESTRDLASELESLRELPFELPARLMRRAVLGGILGAVILGVALLVGLNVGGLRNRLLGGASRVDSLAVLPLENLSGDPEQDYLADSVHEALITDLAKLSGLKKVIARSSVMQYRRPETSLSRIARELGVDALVTGSVLRAGDRIQVTAHLIQASTEDQLWADRYEREFRDVLSLGNDVVVAITRAIRLQLTPQESERLEVARTVNPEAYAAYAKGMYYLYKKTPEGFANGLALLQQAIDRDPSDALPHAGLALAYPIIYHGPGGDTPPKEGFPRAREAALQALELDANSAQAHLALAAIKTYFDWDWDGAEREFLRALELNSNFVEAHAHYGWYLHLFNRNEEALAELKKAQELDPLTPIYTAWIGWLCLNIGDLENARLEASKALQIDPNLPDALYVLGNVYRKEKAFEEAIAVGQKLAAVNPDWRFGLAGGYADAGRTHEALQLVADMERENYPKFGIHIGVIQTILGNKDEALRALEAAFDYHHIFLPWTMRDSRWREDRRWQEMRRRLNFPTG